MPLPGPSGRSPGGMLRCVYRDASTGASHTLTLHTAWFDQTPSGPSNDRLYVPGGPVRPSEAGILDTFAALATLWAPYYSADWTLLLDSLWLNSAGTLTWLDPGPVAAPVVGSAGDAGATPKLDRIFKLLGQDAARRELWLQDVPTTIQGVTVEVSPTAGGIDARDQAWMDYLSGNTGGGVVMPDGTYAFPITDLRVWWAKRPFELAGSAGSAVDGSGRLATTCLVYPHGAVICNPSADHLNVSSAGGFDWRISNTGLTISYGTHLAWTFTPTQMIDAAGTILETLAL